MVMQKKKVGRPRKEVKEPSKKLEDKVVKTPKKPQDIIVFVTMKVGEKREKSRVGGMALWWSLGLVTGYLIGSMLQVTITAL